MSEDVLEQYEFHVQIAEEDVRDGDATPWERVVAAFASTIRELRARVAELEKQHTDDDVRFALHLNRAMAAEEKSALAEMRAIGQKAHIEAVEAKVAELREALSGHRDLDQTYALTDAEKRIAELQARVAELETQCDRCGLKLAHDPTPGITVCQSELTFTPGEVIYIPATVRYYPSATPGEPDVKEETYP
jgi:chromosome segregation ATPase